MGNVGNPLHKPTLNAAAAAIDGGGRTEAPERDEDEPP
jgi:hypothetical protein